MAYVPVPKDLSKIKTKLAFNLTKRQLVCFSSAAAVGLPAYLFSRGSIGNSAAMFLMIGLMLPFFFLAMYERDGLPLEKVLKNIIRTLFVTPRHTASFPLRVSMARSLLMAAEDGFCKTACFE